MSFCSKLFCGNIECIVGGHSHTDYPIGVSHDPIREEFLITACSQSDAAKKHIGPFSVKSHSMLGSPTAPASLAARME